MDGWGTVRDSNTYTAVVIGDAFFPPTEWNGFMTQGWNNVILDTHHYEVFSPGELSRSIDEHVGIACGQGQMLRNVDKWTVVGEWSGALTDCTKYLNGIGRGARWEGSFPGSFPIGTCEGRLQGSVAQFSPEARANTRR
jgi:glucan 1,3-beta-glucosidase